MVVFVGFILLAACNSGPAKPEAERWSVRQMTSPDDPAEDFGGWLPGELVVKGGQPLLFQPDQVQVGDAGLTLFPAVANGKAAAFVITDVWQNAPTPWVQPVWLLRDDHGAPVDLPNVFPVGDQSTFYSPFWRAEEVRLQNPTGGTYRSSREVLSAAAGFVAGSIIFCPIVLDDTGFADDGSGTKDPMTRSLVTLKPAPPLVHPGWLPRAVSHGYVDGASVAYFDFGLDHAIADEQTLSVAKAFFFVSKAGQRPLPLAAVLPADALRHALVQRVDVVLPPGAAPFVPANRPELRTLLGNPDLGLTVPVITDAALDAFSQYTLRVAANPSCFSDATFPSACDWLDSPARIEALPSSSKLEQPVQLGIGVVLP